MQPRLIVEVEIDNRSLESAHRRCKRHFDPRELPALQVVVLIKVFGRRTNGTFAAVAVQYHRNGQRNNGVDVVDAVSFGTTPPHHTVHDLLDPLLQQTGRQVRELLPAPNHTGDQNPWLTDPNAPPEFSQMDSIAVSVQLAVREVKTVTLAEARFQRLLLGPAIDQGVIDAATAHRNGVVAHQDNCIDWVIQAMNHGAGQQVQALAQGQPQGQEQQPGLQPTDPYLLLRADDIFEDTGYVHPDWQLFCFVNLWEVLKIAIVYQH